VTAEGGADELEELYGVRPEDFMALRTKLVAAAKKRGDAGAAKRIGAARRPTTAAWVVNALVHGDRHARDRLRDLGVRLRAAHGAMDGNKIRELSSEQRRLVDELARAGLAAAGLSAASAALRDDVVGTLQAAIADPDVADRLGTMSKAERWSGFGDFGSISEVGVAPNKRKAAPSKPAPETAPTPDDVAARAELVTSARAEVEAAARAHSDATEQLRERSAKLAAARRRYEKLLESLSAAEHDVDEADADLIAADQSVRGAAERLDKAKVELAQAESALGAVNGNDPPTGDR